MQSEGLTKELIARKFALGQILDIEIQDVGKSRFQSPLVGMKDGRYLVAEMPSLTKHGNLRDQLLEEQELIVRTICEKTTGECLGFKSYIYAKLKLPDQLLFLTFPPAVKIHELRNEKRLQVTQEAIIKPGASDTDLRGMLTDLSGGGCRFEFRQKDGVSFNKDDRLKIEFEHPETGKILSSSARICSMKNSQQIVTIGLAFDK